LCISACPYDAIVRKEKVSEKDFSDYSGIFVFAEKDKLGLKEVACQLISKGFELANDLDSFVTTIIINPTESEIEKIKSAGSERIIKVNANIPKKGDLLLEAAILAEVLRAYKPNIFLLGATPDGRSLGPRIAAKLNTGLTADCTKLSIKDGLLIQTRPAYGGNLMAEIICPNHRPQMATVRPNTFPINSYQLDCTVVDYYFDKDIDTKIRVLDDLYQENESDLEHAEIIVGVGRGIGSKENLNLVFEFAEKIGASVAASRPLVDAGWLEYDRQVGQTGKTVAPKTYIACGISGAIQHIAGVSSADRIIAINNDPDAPIFKYADYSIIGNITEVLEKINESKFIK
jgi:electron transfer flavoprotein alpha subunit